MIQNQFQFLGITVAFELSIFLQTPNPIVRRSLKLQFLEMGFFPWGLVQVDFYDPSGIVQRIYSDAVTVLPLAIALTQIPVLNIGVHVVCHQIIQVVNIRGQ